MDAEEDERARRVILRGKTLTLLDGSRDATERNVEMTALRKVCTRGIPNRPPHLRPLAYNLLLETLPAEKRSWRAAAKQDRERYYTLLESFMDDLQEAPPPTDPPTERDALLQTISKDVDRFISRLPLLRRRTAPSRRSPLHAPPADNARMADVPSESSSSDDDELDESAARQVDESPVKGKGKGKGKAKVTSYMQNRRALFSRLEVLAVAEHQRQAEARRQASGIASSSGASHSEKAAAAPKTEETGPILSPRITLSPEPDEPSSTSTFSSIPPTGSSHSSNLKTPELSLSVSDDAGPASGKDSITLLSPRPIPAPGTAHLSLISGSLLQPETHAECLVRLLYVFCQVHPQWAYKSHFVDIVVPLYLVYSGPNGKEPWAEEQTFWALAGIMSDLGSVISADEDGLQSALDRLGRRVKWADHDLHSSLRSRNLDPASPTFAYRWMTSLFTNTLPPPAVFPIWDFLLSEPSATVSNQPKLDLLVDICVALLILLKPRLNHAGVVTRHKPGLWGDDDSHGDEDPNSDAFVNGFNLLRNPPLAKIGGVEALLQTAYKVRQARMVAGLSGDDPDSIAAASETSYLSWAPSLPALSQYAPALPTSESLASLTKASSTWTAAARAKWWTTSQQASNTAATTAATASTSIGAAAGRLWSTMRGGNSTSEAAEFDHDQSTVSTPEVQAQMSPPPKFVEPKDTIRYTAVPPSLLARRGQHEANTAAGPAAASTSPVAGITEKLSNLASSLTGSPVAEKDKGARPTSFGSSPGGPRPLLLSGSARRASNSSGTGTSGRFRESSPTTPADSPPTRALSPPATSSSSRLFSPRRRESDDTDAGEPIGTLKSGILMGSLATSRLSTIGAFKRIRPFGPLLCVAGLATSARAMQQARSANYPDHVPLNTAQNALLAVGSGVMGVLDTTRGDLIATLSESTASTFLPSLHDAMVAHPEGRQIMKDRPIVSSQTVNLDHLQSLKRGTLGREYVEWLHRSNLSPDSREKVRYIDSPTLAYTMLRYRQTHDLYHTVFSLPPTLVHELSLKVVELSNMSLPVAALSSTFGPLRMTASRRQLWYQDWVPWALRTGRAGRSLVGVYWEKRWEQGLGELRQELGVKRNDAFGVEARWKGYRELRDMERDLRRKGEWVDEPEDW